MIIFDLDGTLVDSEPSIFAAFEHAWYAVVTGAPFPRERCRIGPPLLETIAALSPALDRDQVSAIAEAFRAHYDAGDFSATLPYPGVLEVLDALTARGEGLAVATNKRHAPTLAIVERWFAGRFARVACIDGVWPDDGTRLADKTAMLRWLTPGPAVMVGDTAGDILAARAAGLRSVAVTWGYGDAGSLADARPDVLVSDGPSLLAALLMAP